MSHPGVLPITTDANGNGSATIASSLQNLFWRITQVSVDFGGAQVCSVQLTINDFPCTSLCTGASPLTASGVPSIDIAGHDVMKVNITAGPRSKNGKVTYYYDEIQGTP